LVLVCPGEGEALKYSISCPDADAHGAQKKNNGRIFFPGHLGI
jgi:hypothetical protein